MPEPASRYDTCLEVCGKLERPGLVAPRWVDHSTLDTTVDQARIEDALDNMDLDGRQILHVGVGNSRLAQRFAPRVRLVDGLTVCEAEEKLANSLQIANYTVHVLSKHSREFLMTIKHRYDYIVDNNLASFACCKYHFYRMFDNYLWCLHPDGRVLTDQRGMYFTAENDARWQLAYDDLVDLGKRFPVEVGKVTGTVYEIRHRHR